ncbi:hypothetical protein PRNP1_008400 [Phytophthora ramorum]
MLPALTTKPKQAVRQVRGLSNDSIDSYSNMPLGGGAGIGATYVDNTESGSGTARGSPPASNRSTINSGRASVAKPSANEEGATLARVVRDRKASGEEELSLRTGDIVKVLSSKRTGYLKCEAGDEVGYVPSSYLEFLDEAENANGTAASEETQTRAAEKQRKKQQRKEKRKKEKREVNGASDPEEAVPVSARSPRKEVPAAEDEGNESPRKSKKKNRKHRPDREDDDAGRAGASGVDEAPTSARSRAAPEDTERSRSKSKHPKKKRHRDADSSVSSGSDAGKRAARHGRRRRHRRGSSESDSGSTSSDDSDGSYRRRRRRRRHRHRRSSEEEDEDDSDYKRRSRRSKKRRDKGGGESEPEEGSRSARKAEKKLAAALQEAEKGVSQLDVRSDEKASEPVEAKTTASSNKKEEPDRERGKKEETERSEGSSEGRATNVSTGRKDDEGRASSSASSSSQKQNGNSKTGLGRQIGDRMRSFLGGSKKQHSSKSSSGILNACTGTVQGEEGWYEHGENERYYFVLVDGKWSLLYGPMTEDDFEVFSNRVLEQSRSIELPPTYLHKSGYYLNRELRVQKEK